MQIDNLYRFVNSPTTDLRIVLRSVSAGSWRSQRRLFSFCFLRSYARSTVVCAVRWDSGFCEEKHRLGCRELALTLVFGSRSVNSCSLRLHAVSYRPYYCLCLLNTVAFGAGLRALFWVKFGKKELLNLVFVFHMYWLIYCSQINSLTLGFGVIACANEILKSINLLVIITISFTALKTRKQH